MVDIPPERMGRAITYEGKAMRKKKKIKRNTSPKYWGGRGGARTILG